jgi:hypothetical protein
MLKRLVGLKSSQGRWRGSGCNPGKALSAKRDKIQAAALSVQMASIQSSVRRGGGHRAAIHLSFRAQLRWSMTVLACILALCLAHFLSQCVGRSLMLSSPKVWESPGLLLW